MVQINTITNVHVDPFSRIPCDAGSHHSQRLFCGKQWSHSGKAIVIRGRSGSLLGKQVLCHTTLHCANPCAVLTVQVQQIFVKEQISTLFKNKAAIAQKLKA